MTHDFQAHGLTQPESAAAIGRIRAAIAYYICAAGDRPAFDASGATEIRNEVSKPMINQTDATNSPPTI
jgi:hypothetical protein